MFLFHKKKKSIFQYKDTTLLSEKAHPKFSPLDNNNVMVYGGSGTGKSHCFVVPNLMLKNASYVVADPGGDLYRQTASYMESDVGGKYRVLVLNLKNPYSKHSMHYNPFNYIYTESDVRYFAKCIYNSGGVGGKRSKSKDPFWDNMGEILIQGCVFMLCERYTAPARNLASLLKLISLFGHIGSGSFRENNLEDRSINYFIENQKKFFIERLNKSENESKSVEALTFINNNPDNTYLCILSSAVNMLTGFVTDDIKELTRFDELHLTHFTDTPTILYIIYDETDPTKNALLNLLYIQLFNILYQQAAKKDEHRLDFPVRFIIDDFANTDIPNFSEYLATCRKYNISICPILQSPNQLIEKYGFTGARTIEANCASQLFTGSSDLNEIHDIAKLFCMPVQDVLSLKKFEFLSVCDKKISISKAIDPENFQECKYLVHLTDIELESPDCENVYFHSNYSLIPKPFHFWIFSFSVSFSLIFFLLQIESKK